MKLIGVFVGCALIGGCNPAAVFKPDSEAFIEEGWRPHPKEVKTPQPLYCYDTLAQKVCYTAPLAKGDRRLSGFYGAKP